MESRHYFEQAMEQFYMFPRDWQLKSIQFDNGNIEIIAFFDRKRSKLS